MPRTQKIGRPKTKADEKKYNFTIRLADYERWILESKFKTVQNAIRYLLAMEQKNVMSNTKEG